MSTRFFLILIVALGTLSACVQEQFVDLSDDDKFKHVLGAQYEIVGPVDAYGIRKHSKAPVDYITFIPPPGIGGYEVDFRIPIKVGSKITVLKVLKSNRWFVSGITFLVRLDGTSMPVDKPARIDFFRGNEGKGQLQLNPDIYSPLFK